MFDKAFKRMTERGVTVNIKTSPEEKPENQSETTYEVLEVENDYRRAFLFAAGVSTGIALGYFATRSLLKLKSSPIINIVR